MLDKFNDIAAKSLVHLVSNMSINLETVPLIALTGGEGAKTIELGAGTTFCFNDGHEKQLRKGIEDFNAAGGRYCWLSQDIAINLDVITAIAAIGKNLLVTYPGGFWKSGDCDNAQDIYERYLKAVKAEAESAFGPGAKARILKLQNPAS